MTPLDRLAARREGDFSRVTRRLERLGLLHQPVSAAALPFVCVRGRRLLNFASANYLGLAAHAALRQAAGCVAQEWGVSLSQPRAYASDTLSLSLERELARLAGQESALLFASTLHAAHDIFALLAGRRGVIFLDERAYPISEAGARAAGAAIQRFAHNDPEDLARRLRRCRARERVIVCDGLYMAEGAPAELVAFGRLAEEHDAYLYVDDTQGVGILGRGPEAGMPYGYGGGGTPAFSGAPPGRLIHVASLAKALGTPLTFAAGPAGFIDYLRVAAFSHSHNSPPSLPVAAAALAAVLRHAVEGDARRRRLLRLVRLFRAGMAGHQLSPHELPMQSLYFATAGEALELAVRLRRGGIWPVVQLDPQDHRRGVVRFLFTAVHGTSNVEQAITAINKAV